LSYLGGGGGSLQTTLQNNLRAGKADGEGVGSPVNGRVDIRQPRLPKYQPVMPKGRYHKVTLTGVILIQLHRHGSCLKGCILPGPIGKLDHSLLDPVRWEIKLSHQTPVNKVFRGTRVNETLGIVSIHLGGKGNQNLAQIR
jgi:hypothetical protein